MFTLDVLFNLVFPGLSCVVLLFTYLITSADSAVLVINTIVSGVWSKITSQHIVLWSLLLGLVIITLLFAGMDALRSVMIIALPLSAVMFFMMVSLLHAKNRSRKGMGQSGS